MGVAIVVLAALVWLFFALFWTEREKRTYWEGEGDRWRERYFALLADTNDILREAGAKQIQPRITQMGDRAYRIDPDPRMTEESETL